MKIFLTGKQGMLARAIAEVLSPREQVSGASHAEADIADENAMRTVLEAAKPDVVVNAAAFTDVDACETQRELAFRVNAEGPRNLAIICKDMDIPLMHISTDYVFDGEKTEPYAEEDEARPLSVYGKSKLQGEREVQSHLDRSWVVRVCSVFGPYRNNFVSLVADMGGKGSPLKIVKDQRLAPTYTFDAAAGIGRILRRGPYGTYHLTNQGFTSRLEFTHEILRQAGFENAPVIPISSEETNRPAKRPRNSQLENARLKREGIELLSAWEDAVRRYLIQLAQGNS
ncbi:MAG TPA: dTDP-4-dehydrorhamnose reductase [Candidatus Acidoferrales bacterium]|nr:dTDP-4-dehydrorhamnose reductase [Candidatus Acidoferrales bacterium]